MTTVAAAEPVENGETAETVDVFLDPDDAEELLGMPALGFIPKIEEEGLRLIRDISTFSPLMESYRSLRVNLRFVAEQPLRTLLVTSSVPAEGKSTVVANLAMAMAMDNKRVIVVDADLRRPAQHKLFKMDALPGLVDVLRGTHKLKDVLRSTSVENVSVITAGTPPTNPTELLGSEAMTRLLTDLQKLSDIVLLDSPPLLAVADGMVLAAQVSGVLVVIGIGETKKISTQKTMHLLARAKASVLGIAMNRMNGPANGYYYGKYYVSSETTQETPAAAAAVAPPRERVRKERKKR